MGLKIDVGASRVSFGMVTVGQYDGNFFWKMTALCVDHLCILQCNFPFLCTQFKLT